MGKKSRTLSFTMNTALVVALCMCVGLVHCETCTQTSDCMHTTCDASAPLACENSVCQCVAPATTDAPPATGTTCTHANDCHVHHTAHCQHGSHSQCNSSGMCECVSH